MSRARRSAAGALLLAVTGCAFSSESDSDVADLRGTWQYSGMQSAPALTLEGLLLLQTQSGDFVSGQLSWQERDAGGGVRTDGGPVSGLVIGFTDVDFDVFVGGVVRRHVGRVVADTIAGGWLEPSSGRSGEFRAVR